MVEQEPCVLIVDDELGDLERVKKALASIRLRVLTVRDPHEVLRKVESERPHLVILDALLPGLSGFDLCKQIKTEPETKDTLVVILTGVYLKDHYRQEALHQFKADGFVTKPFRDRELQRLVLKLLAKRLDASPGELQAQLVESKDILLSTELEEKPNWFNRIFGRLKGTTAAAERSGILQSATEDRVDEEPSRDEQDEKDLRGETLSEAETEESERDEVPGESEVVETEAAGGKVPESVDEEPEEPPELHPAPGGDDISTKDEEEKAVELDSSPKSDMTEASAVDELKEKRESTAESEVEDEKRYSEPAAAEEETRGSAEEQEKIPAAAGVLPSSDSGVVDLDSARAVFEALGDVGEETPATESAEEDAVVEDVEESATERTMPAAAPVLDVVNEVVQQSVPTTEAAAGPAETPVSPPRPKALHEELPIYQEEDYLHELRREVSMCERLGRPITLIMVRVADLDQIVELLGKQFRSKVLFHVAEHALEALREIDMVGLLESEELIALTAFASDRYGGDKIVSRLRTALEHNPFEVGVGLPSFIPDLRFGIAVYPRDATGTEDMIERAKAELAAAQRSK
jgi:CheY-like chemotaxis protein/GGDEF domain-containing protein